MNSKYIVDLKIITEDETLFVYQYGGKTRGKVPCLISTLNSINRKMGLEIISEIKNDKTILDDPKTLKELEEMFGPAIEETFKNTDEEAPGH